MADEIQTSPAVQESDLPDTSSAEALAEAPISEAAATPIHHHASVQERESGKMKVGRVVSNKMDKTIVVAVEHLKKHRIYKKTMRLTRKFKAHDERNEASIGDIVRIEESRPVSKEKSWRLTQIIQRANEI